MAHVRTMSGYWCCICFSQSSLVFWNPEKCRPAWIGPQMANHLWVGCNKTTSPKQSHENYIFIYIYHGWRESLFSKPKPHFQGPSFGVHNKRGVKSKSHGRLDDNFARPSGTCTCWTLLSRFFSSTQWDSMGSIMQWLLCKDCCHMYLQLSGGKLVDPCLSSFTC